MKKLTIGIGFLTLLGSAATGTAKEASLESKYLNGSALSDLCNTPEGTTKRDKDLYYMRRYACRHYAMAVADTFSCDQQLFGFRWQPNAQIEGQQLARVVTKWLNEHPEKLHLSASSLVAEALSTAFPCS